MGVGDCCRGGARGCVQWGLGQQSVGGMDLRGAGAQRVCGQSLRNALTFVPWLPVLAPCAAVLEPGPPDPGRGPCTPRGPGGAGGILSSCFLLTTRALLKRSHYTPLRLGVAAGLMAATHSNQVDAIFATPAQPNSQRSLHTHPLAVVSPSPAAPLPARALPAGGGQRGRHCVAPLQPQAQGRGPLSGGRDRCAALLCGGLGFKIGGVLVRGADVQPQGALLTRTLVHAPLASSFQGAVARV